MTFHSFLRKYEIWLVLTLIVILNAIFVNSIVYGLLPDSLYQTGRFLLLAGVLFSCVFLSRGITGVLDILRPMIRWRIAPGIGIFALTWVVLFCVCFLLVKGWVTGSYTDMATLQKGLEKLSTPFIIKAIILSSFVGEVVWVSYAIRRLSKLYGHYISGLIVGITWTLWWWPMAIHNFGIIPDLPLSAFLLNQTGVALMCAFVYYHSRSGLLVLLMQISFNSALLVFPVTPETGGTGTYQVFAISCFCVATLMFMCFGPKLPGFRSFGAIPGKAVGDNL